MSNCGAGLVGAAKVVGSMGGVLAGSRLGGGLPAGGSGASCGLRWALKLLV